MTDVRESLCPAGKRAAGRTIDPAVLDERLEAHDVALVRFEGDWVIVHARHARLRHQLQQRERLAPPAAVWKRALRVVE